ncbi:hypothetical protein ACFVVU_03900 [Kitasatospora sp. NPDC057965]|uniref:COG4315 family predicted lipoprotein n=1 Tax=Kitasatospora sp. NPDC057965 TaxID=3346291 RepID=UPI0036DB6EE6
MNQRRLAAVSLAAVTLLTAVCGGCSSSKSTTGQSSPSPTATQPTSTATGTATSTPTGAGGAAIVAAAPIGQFGDILVDSQGMTLYLFEKDTSTASTCYGDCAAAWPPALTEGAPTAAHGAEQTKLSTSTRTDGKTQIVYNGHPLYHFQGDKAQGDTNGQESSAFGAKWYVVNPAGNKVESS